MQKLGELVTEQRLSTVRETSSIQQKRTMDTIPDSVITSVKSSMSDAISALSAESEYDMRWNEKLGRDEFVEIRSRSRVSSEIEKAFPGDFKHLQRAQYVLCTPYLIKEHLSRLMAFKRAQKGEGELSVIINELAHDYAGRVSVLVLLIVFDEIKKSDTPWFPDYHVVAKLFEEWIERTKGFEADIQQEAKQFLLTKQES